MTFEEMVALGVPNDPTFRVIVTGSRNWRNYTVIRQRFAHLLHELGTVTVVHGANPSGADAIADEIAREMGFGTEPHPAKWELGRRAGPLRNQAMVQLGADFCLAFPCPQSRGTWDCVKRASRAGIPAIVHPASEWDA